MADARFCAFVAEAPETRLAGLWIGDRLNTAGAAIDAGADGTLADRLEQPHAHKLRRQAHRVKRRGIASERVVRLLQRISRAISILPADGGVTGNRDGVFRSPVGVLRLQHGTENRIRRSFRVTANFNHGLEHRSADGRRQGAAIVDMARDATAIDELRPEFANLLGINRVGLLGMRAVAKIRVMQTPPEQERFAGGGRGVWSHLF